jgi:hypothetical protein
MRFLNGKKTFDDRELDNVSEALRYRLNKLSQLRLRGELTRNKPKPKILPRNHNRRSQIERRQLHDESETQERQRIRLLSASNRGPAKHLHNPYRVRLRLLVKCVYEHGMNTRIKGDSCHRHTQRDSHPLACNTMLNPNPPISIEMDPIQSRPAPYIYNVSNHQHVFRTSSSSVAMFDKSAKKESAQLLPIFIKSESFESLPLMAAGERQKYFPGESQYSKHSNYLTV